MRKKLKRILLVILIFVLAFAAYVEIVNRNSNGMNYRQKVLKAIYPALMWFNKVTGKRAKVIENKQVIEPVSNLYKLYITLNDGSTHPISEWQGKKLLLVNTASECGYTDQYEALQALYGRYKDKLVIIAFPANDFKEQEKGSDEEIARFCKINYGVTFPLAKKSTVVRGETQNPVFKWLTEKNQNGWNEQAPTWNFSKYLVDEQGRLARYFDPGVSPLSDEVIKAVEQ